jgi:hypothetical protein
VSEIHETTKLHDLIAKWRQPALSVFVGLYSYCLIMLACPNWWGWTRVLIEPIAPVWASLDAVNQFSLFFPDPPRHHYRFDCDIQFDDGSWARWTYPPSTGLFIDRALYMRFFYVYMITIKPGTATFCDLCRQVARQYNSPTKHPVLVRFNQYIATIPPFDAPAKAGDSLAEKKTIMYTYHVNAGDLK